MGGGRGCGVCEVGSGMDGGEWTTGPMLGVGQSTETDGTGESLAFIDMAL